jgi:hypothetical protein
MDKRFGSWSSQAHAWSFVPPNNPIDLQSLKLIDFHLLRWSAQQRLFTVLGALTSMLRTSAQLRLENLALRQQLAVLRRSAPKRLKLTPADRILRVCYIGHSWRTALIAIGGELTWRSAKMHRSPEEYSLQQRCCGGDS